MVFIALAPSLPLAQPWESLVRVTVLTGVLLLLSREPIRAMRVKHWIPGIALGLAVCALWVAPDLLFPGWRSHWLFQNAVTGHISNSIAPDDLSNPLVLALRIARAALLVPIIEELFWRGWLPRWIVDNNWQRVPIGTYSKLAFLVTAVLFASEHGPFWEVGLLCGLIYNWWMWRTRSLGDLVLVHGVTNAALSAFVLLTGRYEYWM